MKSKITLILIFIGVFLSAQSARVLCNTEDGTPFISSRFDNLSVSSKGLFSKTNHQIDNDLSNYSTAGGFLGIDASIRVTDNNDTYPAGLYVGYEYNIINVSIGDIGTVTISTYKQGQKQESKSYTSANIIEVNGKMKSGFTTTKDFDAIEVRYQAAAIGIPTFRAYGAFINKHCPSSVGLNCNDPVALVRPRFAAYINESRTGVSGVNVGGVLNAQAVTDQDTSNYASLTNVVSIAGSTFLSVKDEAQTHAAGTFAGFDIENANFVTANIFNNIIITTYLKDQKQEEKLGSGLQLLSGGLIDFKNRTTVGFETTKPFDEIKITTWQPVGVTLGTTKVFSAVIKKFCEGPVLVCNTNTILTERKYPVSISSERTGVYGVFSAISSVTEPDNLLDDNTSNYASITVPATIGTGATISVKKSLSKFPVGTFAGFEFKNSNFLSIDILQFVTINTYKNGALQETVTGNGLVFNIGTDLFGNSGQYTLGLVAKKEFDEVQLSIINVTGVNLGTTKVYKLVVMNTCPKTIECNKSYYWNQPEFPVVLNARRTGMVSILSVGSSVRNPDHLIDNDPNTSAKIVVAAGIANAGQISVVDPSAEYPKGTFAGFTIKDNYLGVQADLLEFITVNTYLNGIRQESKTSTNLVDISLLVPIWGTGTKNVGFKTTKPFNEVQIVLSSVASVINVVDVYGVFIDTRTSDGNSLNCLEAIDAVNDYINVYAGGTSDASVITNDTYQGAPAVIGTAANQVKITQTSTTNSGVNIDPATGKVVVNPGTAPGTYTINYTLCNNITPPSCDNAQVTVVVANTPIIAVADTFTGYTKGTAGTTPSVLDNDTLDGQPVKVGTNANVILTHGTLPAGFTMNDDGTVQVSATAAAGTHNIPYTICEKANSTNCSTVISTITITNVLVANNDTFSGIPTQAGGTTASVLANDTVNGQAATTTNVILSQVSTSNQNVVLNADGTITVAPNTPIGTYTIVYKITDTENPNNSQQATATVEVTGIIDLQLKMSSSSSTVSLGIPVQIFNTVTNVGTAPTNGNLMTVRFLKTTQPGNYTVDKVPSGWSVTANTSTFIEFTSNNVVQPQESLVFVIGFTKILPGFGLLPFRGVIVSGSGGDSNASNNSSNVSLNQIL